MILVLLSAIGILASCSQPAFCETIPGYDALALARFCDTYLKAPRLPALSTLLNTFGDPIPCVDRAAARGGLKLVKIDLIDATCWRNKVCPAGVPKPDDLKTIDFKSNELP